MIFFFLVALVAYAGNAVIGILPCGTASATCTEPFLALPEQGLDALAYASNALGYVVYILGDGIGNAVVTTANIMVLFYLASLIWGILLYFRVPVVSQVMNIFHANVEK